MKDKAKLASPKRSFERPAQNSKISDDIVVASSSIPKALRKKSVKRRGNIENLEGECYISFQKLLSNELRKVDRRDSYIFDAHMRRSNSNLDHSGVAINSKPIQKINSDNNEAEVVDIEHKRFSEQLWLYGKKIGHAKGIFNIKLGKSIHQMGVGLMTENGVKFSTSLILDGPLKSNKISGVFLKYRDKAEIPEKYKGLSKLKNELIYLESSKKGRSIKGLQEREVLLKQIVEILSDNVGSKNTEMYENELSLIKTQDLFLTLCLH